jgi:hypothetical protein
LTSLVQVSIVDTVNAILAEYDVPLTPRQIYYRLVSANLIPNKDTAYKQLSKTLVKARENDEVDECLAKSVLACLLQNIIKES